MTSSPEERKFMHSPPTALFEEVAAALAPLAPSLLGKRYLAQQDSPRRFVWVLVGETGRESWRPGLSPRVLHKDEWTFEVHCWGQDLEEAYRLRQALVTALRDVARGAHYRLGRTVAPLGEEWTACGDVLVMSVTVFTDLVESDLTALGDAPTFRARPKAAELERPPPEPAAPGRLVSKEE